MGQKCCSQFPDQDYAITNKNHQQKTSLSLPSIYFDPKISPAAQEVEKDLGQWKPTLSFERGQVEAPQILDSDGTTYIGQWKNKLPHGMGKMYFPDQSIFTGCFVEGVPNIEGRLITSQGVYYEGGILNSQAHGIGKLNNKHKGYRYEGSWKQDLPSGFGKQIWGGVSQYQGQFKNGVKDGEGVFRRFGDYLYKGSFKDGVFSGNGTITYNDGQVYEGEWLKGEYNGYGTYKWADESVYEGYFLNAKKEGKGKYRSADGRIFEGTWKGGKRNGPGRLSKGGQYFDGVWLEDKFASKQ